MQECLKSGEIKKLVAKIQSILKNKKDCIIAIDGMCASGKTTLATELARFFDCNIVHMDDFYYPRGTIDLSKSNDGNINLIRLREEIINKIHDDSFIYNVFSCKEQKTVVLHL